MNGSFDSATAKQVDTDHLHFRNEKLRKRRVQQLVIYHSALRDEVHFDPQIWTQELRLFAIVWYYRTLSIRQSSPSSQWSSLVYRIFYFLLLSHAFICFPSGGRSADCGFNVLIPVFLTRLNQGGMTMEPYKGLHRRLALQPSRDNGVLGQVGHCIGAETEMTIDKGKRKQDWVWMY